MQEVDRRVVQAGGKVKGKLSFSLMWETDDDLDLRVRTPTGALIHFDRKWADSGTLDVDMCSSMGLRCTTPRAVENVRFKGGVLPGRYSVMVQNFRYKSGRSHDRAIKFEVLARLGRKRRKLVRGLCTKPHLEREPSTIHVLDVQWRGAGDYDIISEAQHDPNCEIKLGIAAGQATADEIGGRDRTPATAQVGGASGTGQGASPSAERTKSQRQRLTAEELGAMRVGTLKRALRALGGKCRGCTEKHEYVRAMLAAQGGQATGNEDGDDDGGIHVEL